ncbi:GH23554 [Drosophila grimshawi]|uniref:GH23554 n=1 Tax=Drosophila grimshawi TaxID=7222 RepID=B4K1K6_DROGR|nr:GH23554 [Drosophila grimshawi]
MDYLLVTPQLHSVFSSLGSFEGDTYVVSPNAFAILEEINYKLTYEDQTLRTFRRAIGFGQNVRSDLIPLLENAKDDAVLESVIRILVNLTVPVECLFSVDVMYRTEVGRHTIFELNKLLYNCKEAFTDPKVTKSVVEYIKHILESESKLSPQKCDRINNCLLLLRNILHIPETMLQSNSGHQVSMQNTILWNLFIQSIDKLMLYLMTCPQRSNWGVTMVQLIALIYKDQHIPTLEVMHYYGILLEDFNNNGEFVNDCIFTMMHHIGGDLGHTGVLFQPIILKTYSRIWEADYGLCDVSLTLTKHARITFLTFTFYFLLQDWSDLIEYVIHKFMNTPPKSPLTLPTTSLTEMTKEHNQEHTLW